MNEQGDRLAESDTDGNINISLEDIDRNYAHRISIYHKDYFPVSCAIDSVPEIILLERNNVIELPEVEVFSGEKTKHTMY